MRWQVHILKCICVGILPFGATIRRLKRHFLPYPEEFASWKVPEFFRQLSLLNESGFSPEGCRIVEIGSGWHPVFALLYYLAGAKHITLVDRQRLMDARLLAGVAKGLYNLYGGTIATGLHMELDEVQKKLMPTEGVSFDELLASYNMDYRAPVDFSENAEGDEPFDLITSVDVMEHIPPEVLDRILQSCYTKLVEGGRMMHLIDHCDHWSFIDPKLSSVHFLKYGDRAMALLYHLNPLEYQNRLRHDDYVELFLDAGFSILNAATKVDEKALAELNTMKLNKKYMGREHRQLAITTSLLIAGKRNMSMASSCP